MADYPSTREITEDVTWTITTTVNRTGQVADVDAFSMQEITLVNETTTEVQVTNLETGGKFKVTFEYQEEENTDGK